MDALQFAQPAWLAAGIVAGGGLILLYRLIDRKSLADLERFVSGAPLKQFLASVSGPRRWLKRGCFIAAIVMLFVALARPQVGNEWREVKRKGIDILFALDASRSMLAEDVSPNRIERAKLGMIDFVDRLEGDRIGLMPFAGSVFMLCPLTLDYHAFHESLDAIDTNIIPRKGTDLASAIREAGRAFEDVGNNHRILVIITDGEDLQGEALAAAEQAAADGMVIHTVGIGSASGELIPIGSDFVRDQQGELVRSKLDESSLREIAEITGGIYAPFGQGAEGLRQIYSEKLSLVPKGELAQRMQKVPIERFYWPLAAAIGLSMLEFLIGDRRQRSRAHSPVAATALIAFAFFAATNFAEAGDARTTYNDGVQSYQNGDLESASQAFQNTIDSSPDLSLQTRAYYNLGNAIFKTGAAKLGGQSDPQTVIADWERSLEAFDGALALDPDDEDAKFNRDLVQRKIDELEQQQEQEQEQSDSDSKPQGGEEDKESQEQGEGDSGASEEDQPKEENGEDGEGDQEDQEGNPGEAKEDQPENEAKENSEIDDKAGAKPGSEQTEEKEQEEGAEGQVEPKPGEADPGSQAGEAAQSGEEVNPDQQAAGVTEHERGKPGEMSKEEARQLLQALENDEERVLLVPTRRGDPSETNNTTKGKDW